MNAETANPDDADYGSVTNDFDNDADDDGPGHLAIEDGETGDASIGANLAIHSISYVTLNVLDDLDLVAVVGWGP
jgi:hypothetical protein